MKITANVQKLLKDTRPSKVDVTLTIGMSRWSVIRCIIGLKIAAWGFRISGLPVQFNSEVEDDGSTEDQR